MMIRPLTLTAIAFATLTATTLTGCLVKQETPKPPITITNYVLRTYNDGDWIKYNFNATVTSGLTLINRIGTLEIRWGAKTLLTAPDGVTQYSVIEKTILVDNDVSDGEDAVKTVHYVQQNSDGSKTLVAMSGTGNQYYWLNDAGGATVTIDGIQGKAEPVKTFPSPLFVGQNYPYKYYLMDNCGIASSGCLDDVGSSSNSIDVVGNSTQRNTNIGNFANPFEINFSGSITPLGKNATNPLPLYFSIFDICSNGVSQHNGTMFIVPDIGIIELSNNCIALDGNGSNIYYDISIDSTNLSFP